MDVVIVTWQGGGASQPALGLGRLLPAREHHVRILAPASFAERVRAAGCILRHHPPELEFDPSNGRMFEDQEDHAIETFVGHSLAEELGLLGPPRRVLETLRPAHLHRKRVVRRPQYLDRGHPHPNELPSPTPYDGVRTPNSS